VANWRDFPRARYRYWLSLAIIGGTIGCGALLFGLVEGLSWVTACPAARGRSTGGVDWCMCPPPPPMGGGRRVRLVHQRDDRGIRGHLHQEHARPLAPSICLYMDICPPERGARQTPSPVTLIGWHLAFLSTPGVLPRPGGEHLLTHFLRMYHQLTTRIPSKAGW
jgi:hypothetical protein